MWSKSCEVLDPAEAVKKTAQEKPRKKRTRRKWWRDIRWFIQILLLMCSVVAGMTSFFSIAWKQAGLPVEWWTGIVVGGLGSAAAAGLIIWISMTDYE